LRQGQPIRLASNESREAIRGNAFEHSGLVTDVGRIGRPEAHAAAAAPGKMVAVSGIDRAPIRGSFLMSVFGNVGAERVHLGTERC
jgi:hypothetical protein